MARGRYDDILTMIRNGSTDEEIVEHYPRWVEMIRVCRKIVSGDLTPGTEGELMTKPKPRTNNAASLAEKVRGLYFGGYDVKEIADQINKSPRYVRFLLEGSCG